MDHLAGEVRARHEAVIELADGLRLLRVCDRLAGSVPVLAGDHVSLRDTRNHLRRAPVGRFRMVHLLVLQIDVDRVLPGRRVDRRLHIVIERESAGAVEDHVPPGHAVRAIAQVAGAVEILRRIHEEFLHPQRVFPGHRNFQLGAELVGEALPVVRIIDQVLARVLDVHVAVGRNAVRLPAVFHEVGVVGDWRRDESQPS